MEPTLPTSFIPKRPVDAGYQPVRQSSRQVGLLRFFATLVVLVTALSWGGVFLYKRYLVQQKAVLQTSIDEARKGVGTDFVNDMKRLDTRMSATNELLRQHIVVTPIFKALEQSTLRSVQYKSFSYSLKSDGATTDTVSVALTGAARSYATIALQSDAFGQSSVIRNPVFSDLTVDDKARSINFNLSFFVPRDKVSYQAFVESTNSRSTPPVNTIEP